MPTYTCTLFFFQLLYRIPEHRTILDSSIDGIGISSFFHSSENGVISFLVCISLCTRVSISLRLTTGCAITELKVKCIFYVD